MTRSIGQASTGDAEDVLQSQAPDLTRDQIIDLLAESWGVTARELKALPSERDHNVMINGELVLKISNPAEQLDVLDMENASLAHVTRVAADLPVPRLVATRMRKLTAALRDGLGRPCQARLLTVVPGRPLEGTPTSTATAEQVGALAARTSVALQGLFHPAAARSLDWDVRRAPIVLSGAVLGELGTAGPILRALLDRMTAAADATAGLPSGPQHADVTLTNVLAAGGVVTGLIDFGDMHHTAAVCDLAVTLTSVLRNTAGEQLHDTWELVAAVLCGYQRHRQLAPAEVDVLGDLVLARLGLTLALSARRVQTHSENATYINQYDASTRRVLDHLAALEADELQDRFHTLAGTRRAPERNRGRQVKPSNPNLLDRRCAVMGGPLSPPVLH